MKVNSLVGILLIIYTVSLAWPQTEKWNIAVVNLEGNGVSVEELKGLSNRLRSELFQTSTFTVIERYQMDDILKEQKFQLSGCTSQECVVEVGQLLGVRFIVAGSIDRVGEIYSTDIRMVNVETGKIEKNVIADCDNCGLEDVMKVTLHNAARKLAGLEADRNLSPKNTGVGNSGHGDLFIQSKPSGALIYFDDVLQEGKTTPVTLLRMPAGNHEVKVIKDGLLGIKRLFIQNKGLVKVDLPLQKGSGDLKLFSKPVGAEVYLDGVKMGNAPVFLQKLSIGNHRITCKKEGYLSLTKKINIDIGKTESEHCTLEEGTLFHFQAQENEYKNRLQVSVSLGTTQLGITPFTTRLPLGSHRFTASLADYNSQEQTIETKNNKSMDVHFELKHSDAYYKRLEQEQLRKDALKKQRALQLKKTKRIAHLTAKIATGAMAVIGAGLSYYYYTHSQDEVRAANNYKNQYDNAYSDFDTYQALYTQKKKDSEESQYRSLLFLGATGGMGLLCGVTFVF
ncbi:MAG: PEGA domain-containing protein [Fibrobacteria bacterium]|nr:PEGA domain-containing protein [Fibrobacteria bacterium]